MYERVEQVVVEVGPAPSRPTQRVLQAWVTRDPGAGKTEAAVLRQAIADADWDTVERHSGLDAVVDTIDQAEEKTAASAGAGSIDDFRLRGSRTWRRMGGPLTRGGWRTGVAHVVAYDFDNYKSALSQGEALAVVVQVVSGNPYWTRVGTDSPESYGVKPRAAPASRVHPPRTARRGATREGEEVEGATPPFWPLVRRRGGVSGPPFGPPLTPPLRGGRSLHSDPWREGH